MDKYFANDNYFILVGKIDKIITRKSKMGNDYYWVDLENGSGRHFHFSLLNELYQNAKENLREGYITIIVGNLDTWKKESKNGLIFEDLTLRVNQYYVLGEDSVELGNAIDSASNDNNGVQSTNSHIDSNTLLAQFQNNSGFAKPSATGTPYQNEPDKQSGTKDIEPVASQEQGSQNQNSQDKQDNQDSDAQDDVTFTDGDSETSSDDWSFDKKKEVKESPENDGKKGKDPWAEFEKELDFAESYDPWADDEEDE